MKIILFLSFFLVHVLCGCLEVVRDTPIYLNQVQTLTTHNSYKYTSPNNPVYQFPFLKYTFPPLSEQLDAGIRGIEIDFQCKNIDTFFIYQNKKKKKNQI